MQTDEWDQMLNQKYNQYHDIFLYIRKKLLFFYLKNSPSDSSHSKLICNVLIIYCSCKVILPLGESQRHRPFMWDSQTTPI